MKTTILAAALFCGSVLHAELVDSRIYRDADAAKITALETAVKKNGDNYRARMRLAAAYAAAGKIANAESAYRGAMRTAPDALEPYHALALLDIRNTRYAEAAKVSREWLKKDPKSYYGRFCLADALSLGGDVKASVPVLQELLRSYPSDTYVMRGLRARYEALGMDAEVTLMDARITEASVQ